MTMKNAIELGLLETLMAAGGKLLTPAEVAAKLPSAANPEAADMVEGMLRLLSSYNVVSCTVEEGKDGRLSRRYGAAPVCKFLTPNKGGVSMLALALMNQDKVLMESWRSTKQRQRWRWEAATVVVCNKNSTEISHREQLKQRALVALVNQ